MDTTSPNDKEVTTQVTLHAFEVEESDNHPTESPEDSADALYPRLTEKGRNHCRLIVDELHSRVEHRCEDYIFLRSRDLARSLPLDVHQIGTYLSEYIPQEPSVEVEKWSQITYCITVEDTEA